MGRWGNRNEDGEIGMDETRGGKKIWKMNWKEKLNYMILWTESEKDLDKVWYENLEPWLRENKIEKRFVKKIWRKGLGTKCRKRIKTEDLENIFRFLKKIRKYLQKLQRNCHISFADSPILPFNFI